MGSEKTGQFEIRPGQNPRQEYKEGRMLRISHEPTGQPTRFPKIGMVGGISGYVLQSHHEKIQAPFSEVRKDLFTLRKGEQGILTILCFSARKGR